MAMVYQPNRTDEDGYNIYNGVDLFILCNNGGSVRISVLDGSIYILPINGVSMNLKVVNGCAGVEFVTQPNQQLHPLNANKPSRESSTLKR